MLFIDYFLSRFPWTGRRTIVWRSFSPSLLRPHCYYSTAAGNLHELFLLYLSIIFQKYISFFGDSAISSLEAKTPCNPMWQNSPPVSPPGGSAESFRPYGAAPLPRAVFHFSYSPCSARGHRYRELPECPRSEFPAGFVQWQIYHCSHTARPSHRTHDPAPHLPCQEP